MCARRAWGRQANGIQALTAHCCLTSPEKRRAASRALHLWLLRGQPVRWLRRSGPALMGVRKRNTVGPCALIHGVLLGLSAPCRERGISSTAGSERSERRSSRRPGRACFPLGCPKRVAGARQDRPCQRLARLRSRACAGRSNAAMAAERACRAARKLTHSCLRRAFGSHRPRTQVTLDRKPPRSNHKRASSRLLCCAGLRADDLRQHLSPSAQRPLAHAKHDAAPGAHAALPPLSHHGTASLSALLPSHGPACLLCDVLTRDSARGSLEPSWLTRSAES